MVSIPILVYKPSKATEYINFIIKLQIRNFRFC